MKKNINIKYLNIFTGTLFAYLFIFINKVQAGTAYTLLEELPGIGQDGIINNFGTYLSNMFTLVLQLATVLAVLMISYGGFKYLTEESFTGVSDAKKKIQDAVTGLVILLVSWLLLYTINPDLVENTFTIPTPGANQSASGGGGGGGWFGGNTDNSNSAGTTALSNIQIRENYNSDARSQGKRAFFMRPSGDQNIPCIDRTNNGFELQNYNSSFGSCVYFR